jgi:ribosomal protein S12 methylthiotransferase accessory factor
MEEALLQGILEVVERDAQAIFTWNQLPMPEVRLDTLPVEEDKALHRAVKALQTSDLQVTLKDITTDTQIPTLYAFGTDESGEGPAFQWGVGSHLDPGIAVSRAITELLQSRAKLLEFMSRIPEDPRDLDSREALRRHPEAARILRLFYLESRELVAYIQHSKQTIGFQDIPDYSHPDIAEEIRICLGFMEASGFDEVIAVDLTRPAVGFPVVRIFIPGAEFIPWADYEVERVGERRLTRVPSLLGYRPSEDYVEGSGKDGNFLI